MLGDIQKRYGIKLFPHTRYISQGNIQTARPRPSYRIGGKVYTRQDEIGSFFGQQGQELSVSAAHIENLCTLLEHRGEVAERPFILFPLSSCEKVVLGIGVNLRVSPSDVVLTWGGQMNKRPHAAQREANNPLTIRK
jgi:hypothetical protein